MAGASRRRCSRLRRSSDNEPESSCFSRDFHRSTFEARSGRDLLLRRPSPIAPDCSCYIPDMLLKRSIAAVLALVVLLTGIGGAWAMATSTASSGAPAVEGCDAGPERAPLDSDLQCDHGCHAAAHLVGVTSASNSAGLHVAGPPASGPGAALRTILISLHLPPPRIDSLLC